jgi:hypothetical protein
MSEIDRGLEQGRCVAGGSAAQGRIERVIGKPDLTVNDAFWVALAINAHKEKMPAAWAAGIAFS